MAMIAGRLCFQTDAIVIGLLSTSDNITFFVIAAKLVEYVKDLFRSVTCVITPLVSRSDFLGDRRFIHKVIIDGTRMSLWGIIPIQSALMILGKPFLTLWMGSSIMFKSWPILVVLSTPLICAIPQALAVRVIYGTGRFHAFSFIVICEALLNLALSVVLVRYYGPLGVALGTCIPNIMSCILVILLVLRLEGITLKSYLSGVSITPVIVSILPITYWLITVGSDNCQTWFSLIVTCLLGFFFYGTGCLMLESSLASLRSRLSHLLTYRQSSI